ncbi:PH domain-containing protein [Georgenia sp. MJ206]|uniref:PH domain-containing protein n=1 Tax=Georgenia wangjunii TaxID=3117730 RepID=UPI002F2628F4
MAEPQRWYPDAGRSRFHGVAVVIGVVILVFAVYRVVAYPHEDRNDGIATVLFFLQAAALLGMGGGGRRTFVEADDAGIAVANGWRPRQIPWGDITELRPNVPYSWATLVVVRRDGTEVELPLPADHRGLLDRWEAVASHREPPAP